MFNNMDSTYVVTNSNDEERTIPAGYYTIGDIIAMLNNTLILCYPYARRLQVTEISESNFLTPSISPLLRSSEKSSY